jgi:hypothetical protein
MKRNKFLAKRNPPKFEITKKCIATKDFESIVMQDKQTGEYFIS